MNALPDSRRAIHGRTHSRAWHGGDMDPIERVRVSRWERVADVLAAVAIGILSAAALAHWWSL